MKTRFSLVCLLVVMAMVLSACAQAARMLLSALRRDVLTQTQVLMPPRLIVGKSTARPPQR